MLLSSIPQQQQQQPPQPRPLPTNYYYNHRNNNNNNSSSNSSTHVVNSRSSGSSGSGSGSGIEYSSSYSSSSSSSFSPSSSHHNSQTNTPTSTSPTKYNKRTLQQYRQELLDNMSITVEEYEEVLNAEVWVEVNKLRDYSRHGISREVRGEVWLYLLRIQQADRSKEISTQKQRLVEYEQIEKEPNEVTKRVRGEISRYLRKTKIESSRDMPRLFEDVISSYCNHNHRVEYYPAMVNLCAPFIYSVKRECDAFLCFEKLINTLDDHYSHKSINESVASFMTLFRTFIPDLYSYFEEEEVDIKEWAASALQFVLSRELSLENLMRLWDTYFALPDSDWLDLHPYFCLAILRHLKEGLEELEQSEIRTMLMRLPSLEMDQIVNEAFNIRHEIIERQISEENM